MKVQEIKIKEFKAIKDLQLAVNGNDVIIHGKNGLGKSTVMQFIEIALGNTNNIPPNFLGEGEVVTHIDGKQFTFKVKTKDGKPVVTVVSPDGLEDKRKGTLQTIVGAIGFDINKFVEQSKSVSGRKEQIESIKKFWNEESKQDLARYENDVNCKYEERTGLSKDLKNIEGTIKTHPLYTYPEKEIRAIKKIDTSTVFADLGKAQEHNKNITEVNTRKNERINQIQKELADVKELEEKIEKLKESILAAEEKNVKADKFLSENTIISVSVFEEQINSSSEQNKKYDAAQELIAHYAKKESLTESVGELTAQIESGRQMIADAIKDNTILDGLGFDNDQLLYNSIPVNPSSLSTSEIMELGYKLKVLENPNIPICLEGLESFDEDKFNALLEFGKKNDIQIFGEQVERGAKELRFEIIGV